jgi:hypothetical protein
MASVTIKLILKNGNAQSLRVAEISNWNGIALATPRTELDGLLTLKESKHAGVYLLTGINTELDKPEAYIGEAEEVGKRLNQQLAKEFWVQAIAFVSRDDTLTKSHFKYIEGRLIEEAKKIGRFDLDNDVMSGAKLPESDRDDMEGFLDRARQLLPVLGCDLLVPVVQHIKSTDGLICKIKNLTACGQRSAKGFVVFKGSQAAGELRNSTQTRGGWIIKIRNRLLESKILVAESGHLTFARDYEFDSPSAAAAIVRGGNANGLTEWRTAEGKTLKEIEGLA